MGYVFQRMFGQDPTQGYCSDPLNEGATFLRGTLAPALILCPQSFTGVGVRQVAAAPVPYSSLYGL